MLLLSHSVISDSLHPHGLQHTRLPWPSPSSGICSNSCPLNWWCHSTIASSVTPFSYPQSFPAPESFLMNWLFASGGQSIGAWRTPFPIWNQSVWPMSISNCCFLTYIQEAGKVVWYSHHFKNFPQFVVIHTVKGFSVVNEAEIHVFLGIPCYLQSNKCWQFDLWCLPACTYRSSLFTYCWNLAWRILSITFSSVQSLSRVRLFATPWTAARQASLSITNSRSSLKLMSIVSVMPSSHLILCHPLLLLPPILPSIRVFSNESTLCMRCPKYWNFSFSIIPSKEHPGPVSFRMDWLDLPAVQGTLKSLLQHHSSKASILWHSAFFTVQLSHPYVTTGKTIALTRRTFVGKVMSLLLNMLSRLIIAFLPRSKHLLISWLQSPSAVIWEPQK